MKHVLDEIICCHRLGLLGKEPLKPPLTFEEQQILARLEPLDEETASLIQDSIQSLVLERHFEAVRSGIRFGVRLAAELAEPTEETG